AGDGDHGRGGLARRHGHDRDHVLKLVPLTGQQRFRERGQPQQRRNRGSQARRAYDVPSPRAGDRRPPVSQRGAPPVALHDGHRTPYQVRNALLSLGPTCIVARPGRCSPVRMRSEARWSSGGRQLTGRSEGELSLTGTAFLLLVVLVTVAAFVATVVLWPRLAASRPQPIIGRALLLLAVNALVVFTAAVALNDEFTFFADWTDLHGAIFGSHGGSTALAGGAATQAAQASLPPLGRPVAASALTARSARRSARARAPRGHHPRATG